MPQRDRHEHLVAQRHRGLFQASHAFRSDPGGQFMGYGGGLVRINRGVHIGVCADYQQHQHQVVEAGAPRPEHAGHLLLVRVGGCAQIALLSEPGVPVVDGPEHADQDIQQIEAFQLVDIERVEEGFPFGAAQHGGLDVAEAEDAEDGDHDYGVSEIAENSLAAIRDHRGDLAAAQYDEQGDRQKQRHQEAEGVHLQRTDGEVVREAAVVDHEAAADGGKQRVVDHPGDKGEESRKDAEAARIPDLKELRHRQHAGFAVTVDHEAGQGQREGDQHREAVPEIERVAGFILHLEDADHRNQPHAGGPVGHADQITARLPPGGEEVGHITGIAPGHFADCDHGNQRYRHKQPIQKRHRITFLGSGGSLPEPISPAAGECGRRGFPHRRRACRPAAPPAVFCRR